MLADTLSSLLTYGVIALGLAWPLAARLACPAPEKFLASAALSLLGAFLLAWSVYVFTLPRTALWALPLLSVLGLAESRRALRVAWGDPEVREMAVAQLIVTGWCVGWLALVVTYSGGFWVADWFGHWQRVTFFLDHGPREILFNGFDPLTSRPPLANVVVGAFLAVTRNDFAHYQLATTFIGSLSFLPAALLARRFGGRTSLRVLAVLIMLSPMFVQNATFAWTKLPAAFFTLVAIYFFLRAHDSDASPSGPIFSAALAAALLTHYSAAPFALVLAVAWFGLGRSHLANSRWWKKTAVAGLAGAAVLATWFGWALVQFGAKGTFLTNSSVTEVAPTPGAQLWNSTLNLRDTFVPPFLRHLDVTFLQQANAWGWWRDWFFQLYQQNLFFIFGSVGWLVLAVLLWNIGRRAAPRVRAAWGLALGFIVVLGIAVVSGRTEWGLAHICLQPLVLLGFALLAAHWDQLGTTWRRVVVAGAAIDLALGIALHFGAQSYLLDQWLAPGRNAAESLISYSPFAVVNLRAKSYLRLTFFGDGFVAHDRASLFFLGALLVLALALVARRHAKA